MKRIFLSLSFCISYTLSLAQSGTWKQLNDLGYPAPNGPVYHENGFTFSIGNTGYYATAGGNNAASTEFYKYNTISNEWERKADFIGRRKDVVSFSIGTKGYAGTGTEPSVSGYKKDFWEYDPATDSWSQKADFGGSSRSGASGFSINGKGYIGTGFYTIGITRYYLVDLWEYNPELNNWIQKANFPGGARFNAKSFVVESTGYFLQGYTTSFVAVNTMWAYNPATNSWAAKAEFPGIARDGASSFGIDTRGYLGFGSSVSGDGLTYKDFWEYNPASDSWIQKNSFPGDERTRAIHFTAGSKGYIGGGENYVPFIGGYLLYDLWEYNPTSDTWVEKRGFSLPGISDPITFSIGSKGYVSTGSGAGIPSPLYKKSWEFDTLTKQWAQKADFINSRYGASAFSINNKGYISCGRLAYNGQSMGDLWEYNPSSDSWTQKANVGPDAGPDYQRYYGVGFSINNKGYVGLGISPYGNPTLNDLWEYDPHLNKWTQKADLPGVTRYDAIAVATSNKGYIITGRSSGLGLLKEFWEYNPLTDSWTNLPEYPGNATERASGFVLGNNIYVGASSPSNFWRFNTFDNTWISLDSFPNLNGRLRSFTIGSKAFVLGNDPNLGRTQLWEYSENNNTLPVSFESLYAFYKNGTANIHWSTSMELNASHYKIQRSIDGINFYNIGHVNAAGNSNNVINYNFPDINAGGLGVSKLFYRLQQMDVDDNFKYSNIVTLHIQETAAILRVYPNPVKNLLYIESTTSSTLNKVYKIIDISGRVIQKGSLTTSGTVSILSVNTLQAGYYFIEVETNGNKQQSPFIKQ